MSLRFRLSLMIVLTMLAVIGAGVLLVVHNARRAVQAEMRSSVNMVLQLIDAELGKTSGNDGHLMEWLTELARLDHIRHLRIQVQEASTRIIHLPSTGRMKTIDESPGWFAWSVAPEPIWAEKRVERADGNHIRIIIEATPQDEIAEAWSEARSFLFLTVTLAMVICVLVHIPLGRDFASVGAILQGLGDIERGDYGRCLPHFSLPEFARIALAFNHTAQTLAKTSDENRTLVQQSLAIQKKERSYLAQELHDELGLAASLEDMVENWRSRNPARLFLRKGVEECAGSAKIHLFRIVQEALTNVIKHADARNVGIHLRLAEADGRQTRRVAVTISDDGKGSEPNQPRTALGSPGMRERVASLGGSFSLETRPGEGVRIEVSVSCGASIP